MGSTVMPYVPIRQILVYSRGTHKAVLMLRAYFDESGDHDKDFICMGGCIADLDAWDKFEKDWEEVLVAYGVRQLHTAQLMTYVPQEEYDGWSRKKCECFLADLLPIVLRTVKLYIGTPENVWEYKVASEPKDDPYFNCLSTCIDCAASYANSFGNDEKVETVFAEHPRHTSRARSLYPQIRDVGGMYSRLATDTYGSPKDILPLQAADMVAFLFRKECERRKGGSQYVMSHHLEKLKNQNWCNRGYFDFDKWPRG